MDAGGRRSRTQAFYPAAGWWFEVSLQQLQESVSRRLYGSRSDSCVLSACYGAMIPSTDVRGT